MNAKQFFPMVAALAVALPAFAQRGTMQDPPRTPQASQPPPTYWQAPPEPVVTTTIQEEPLYVYDQQPIAGRPALVTSEQAQSIIDRFKAEYPKLGSPRFLIYVNRELMDRQDGLRLLRRTERIERPASGGTNGAPAETRTIENTYRASDQPREPLADRQTVRDVERLFGRPLRAGGATLVDQQIAFAGSVAAAPEKDRAALQQLADVAIEILIASKEVTVTTLSGRRTLTIPDIQATAIRLKDAKILSQASSADITMRVPPAALGNFDVREITEATALELMEDLAE